jgi:hypothetical protein
MLREFALLDRERQLPFDPKGFQAAIKGFRNSACDFVLTAADPISHRLGGFAGTQADKQVPQREHAAAKRSDIFSAAAIYLKRRAPEAGIQFQNVSDSAQGHRAASRAWWCGRLART